MLSKPRDSTGLFIDNCFDPVAIRIDNKRSEIGWAMFGMKIHAAVVPPAVGQRCPVESARRFLRGRSEGHMASLARRNNALATEADRKFILRPGLPVTDSRFFAARAALLRKDADVSKRSQSGIIKGRRAREICHRE
jgi:hypothetical protein